MPPSDPAFNNYQPSPTPSADSPVGASKDPNQKVLEYILPINRSLWAIVAGYVALFALLLIPAPLALILGIVALRDLKKHPGKLGKGRAIFAIAFGGFMSLLLAFIILRFSLSPGR